MYLILSLFQPPPPHQMILLFFYMCLQGSKYLPPSLLLAYTAHSSHLPLLDLQEHPAEFPLARKGLSLMTCPGFCLKSDLGFLILDFSPLLVPLSLYCLHMGVFSFFGWAPHLFRKTLRHHLANTGSGPRSLSSSRIPIRHSSQSTLLDS